MRSLYCVIAPAVALAMFSSPVLLAGAQPTTKKRTCCYTNARFAGVCRVEPGKDETCEKILAYLNIPTSAGKNYCGGTDIRGGWKLVPCDEKPQRPDRKTGRIGAPPYSEKAEIMPRDRETK